jgi:hypothetical protein
VEITGGILGDEFKQIAQQFEKSRRKRNTFFYDSFDASTATEARKAEETAKALISAIKRRIAESNPQLKFGV